MLSAPEPPGAGAGGGQGRTPGGILNRWQRGVSGVTTHLGSV